MEYPERLLGGGGAGDVGERFVEREEAGRTLEGHNPSAQQQQQQRQQQPQRQHQQQQQLGERAGSAERYFSVQWMLERERAREASDDCSSAFAIIPVVGVCLLALYLVWLDQAAQGFMLWLAQGTPLARFSPLKIFFTEGLFENWEWAGPGDVGGGGGGADGHIAEAFA